MTKEWIKDNAIYIAQRLYELAQTNRKLKDYETASLLATLATDLYVGNMTEYKYELLQEWIG
jgi:hypothetical protein